MEKTLRQFVIELLESCADLDTPVKIKIGSEDPIPATEIIYDEETNTVLVKV